MSTEFVQQNVFADTKDAIAKDFRLVGNVLLWILRLPFYLLAVPVRSFTWTVGAIKNRRYSPEKLTCPGCGFRGDSGTDGKTCRIKNIRTTGMEKAANEHSCFRCGALFYSKLFVPADKWMR